MLLNIIICEDNDKLRTYYNLIIKSYINEHPGVEMKVSISTGNPRDVNIYMDNQNDAIRFFLLDIEFPDSGIKGIDLATSIRKLDSNAKIVFITTHEELMTLIFDRKVEPLDYISKEIGLKAIKKKLYQDLDVAIERLVPITERNVDTFEFGPKPYVIPTNQINYFESLEYKHSVIMHSSKDTANMPDTLQSIAARLPKFYRAHKSILVNPANIESIDDKRSKLVFKDGSSCDISRRKLVELRKHLNR
ncbi:LytR/AlgR family response regulator transcription factor [Companilactobacillus huachuanensis]|uniref:LytR/AlgR family response regulator transcription factor n=1 Tax=Companilactobacillus huachuanensis TaxID=2559914 RepID=A0ABW1RLZ2_9LACO|nr:LytTR family DNA-binding domain-containing protein [Companilactobacillus huachuanensis]